MGLSNPETVSCPSCSAPVNRKNARAVFKRCTETGKVTCEGCRIGTVTVDVFVERNAKIINDTYGVGA